MSEQETIEKLKAELASVKAELASLRDRPKIGDRVIVVGLTSWEGWEGELIKVDETNGKGVVKVYRKKSQTYQDCPTDLFRIRKAPKAK